MITIPRSITEHWVWEKPERLKWWIDLLLMADKGRVCASISTLSARWGSSEASVRRFIGKLIQNGDIKKEVKGNKSIITIIQTPTPLATPLATPLSKANKEEAIEFNTRGFVAYWNDTMEAQRAVIPKIRSIEGKRKKQILARCREFGKASLVEVVKAMSESDFLNGKNNYGWVANLDWALNHQNYQKILEGNYGNLQQKNQRRRVETSATCAEDYEGTF